MALAQDLGRGAAGILEDSLSTQLDISKAQPPLEPRDLPLTHTSREKPYPMPRQPDTAQCATQPILPLAQPNQSVVMSEQPAQHIAALPCRDGKGVFGGQSMASSLPHTSAEAEWPEEELLGDSRQPFGGGSNLGSAGWGKGGGAMPTSYAQARHEGDNGGVGNTRGVGTEGAREGLVRQLMEADVRALSGIASSQAKWKRLNQVNPAFVML